MVNNDPGELGDNATKDFILRHVFGIAPELIRQPSDLLAMLLKKHYGEEELPELLDDRLVYLLKNNASFSDWPLEKIVPDRDAFLVFLQERWPVYLDCVAKGTDEPLHESPETYGMTLPGPVRLPFDHQDVRVYVDSMFLEGILHAVSYQDADRISNHWARVGLLSDTETDSAERATRLLQKLADLIPAEGSRHEDWEDFAKRWAELTVLFYEIQPTCPDELNDELKELRRRVDEAFEQWLASHFGGMMNLPSSPPAMLHHVPRYLARLLHERTDKRIALVVIDGMSFDEWIVIRRALSQDSSELRFGEDTVFAWVPTITSLSRQALFAGSVPYYFPDSLYSTDKESERWSRFWENEGLPKNAVSYGRGFGSGDLADLKSIIDDPRVRILGVVVDTVDKIMHGTVLGMRGMHAQVSRWAEDGYLSNLLKMLFERDFYVFLTSDHGNVAAEGCGRPSEGVIAEQQGKRVRIYSDKGLRKKTKEDFPDTIEWPGIGLPEDFFPLIAPPRKAFDQKGKEIVSHGGIMLEEVVVPFITVSRRSQ
jgi:hypothetical protein